MTRPTSIALLSIVLSLVLLLHSCASVAPSQISDRKLHIVYLGDIPTHVEGDYQTATTAPHHDMLESVLGSHEAAEQHLAHSYGKSFNGFAAWLLPSEVQHFKNIHGVVSVFESTQLKPLTTRSWDFMGFSKTFTRNLSCESNIIVGLLDTGIWPESESFSDAGLGPVPAKWKGQCQTTLDFKACNRKLIGASFYDISKGVDPSYDFISPRDGYGHGSHTASTAAGTVVKNASFLGVAQGDARGGVPAARIAMYKVCWNSNLGCTSEDILAAFDDAIHDGVDIISVSLGSSFPSLAQYFEDPIAIGSFHAMKKGIFVANSAGNNGGSGLSNYSPWTLTVAASTIDRQYITPLRLGNNLMLKGISLNTFSMEHPWYPLIYAGDAANVSGGYSWNDSRKCERESLDHNKVKGKIVLCDSPYDEEVMLAGGAGVILTSDDALPGDPSLTSMPETIISTSHANKVKSYINSSSFPIATILRTITPHNNAAPVVAEFSSRGPNPITPGILKPDVTAPGVLILAAWANVSQLSPDDSVARYPDYNIISGTSMSCPHAAGAAGYVKSIHPDWSPAAIKSALMTTAYPAFDPSKYEEFGYGAGHIDPVKARDPGLLYDVQPASYISFLCSQGYNSTVLSLLAGEAIVCLDDGPKHVARGARQLNYPSMTVAARIGKPFSVKFSRTVTNVGPPQSTYKAIVNMYSEVKVTVEPDTLSFTSAKQELSYTVKVEGEAPPKDTMMAGSLTWKYADYNVRSPIVVHSIYRSQ